MTRWSLRPWIAVLAVAAAASAAVSRGATENGPPAASGVVSLDVHAQVTSWTS